MLKEFTSLLMRHTLPTRSALVPEMLLRLVTPACPLWTAPGEDSPFQDPFWAFFWPGGQATARYILDNSDVVRGRRVLDVGCGCGAGSIAAAMAGARRVVANDIDPFAVIATQINGDMNDIKLIESNESNFIGSNCEEFDVILIGDMFYDPEFARTLFEWMSELALNKTVLIGDPGRHGLTKERRAQMSLLATYDLPRDCRDENNGFTEASVWLLNK